MPVPYAYSNYYTGTLIFWVSEPLPKLVHFLQANAITNIAGVLLIVGTRPGQMFIRPIVGASMMGRTEGLLGIFSMDIEDDLTPRNGTALPSTTSEQDIFASFGPTCKYRGSQGFYAVGMTGSTRRFRKCGQSIPLV